MSTRANIIIKENKDQSLLYCHNDGDPDYLGQLILSYMEKVLIHKEQLSVEKVLMDFLLGRVYWYADSLEEISKLTQDAEYVYIINLQLKTVQCYLHVPNKDVPFIFDKEHEVEFGNAFLNKPKAIEEWEELNETTNKLIEQIDKILNKMNKRTEDQTNEMLEKLIKSKLNEGIVKFSYFKKNGELRQAEGTTCMLCIPVDQQPSGTGGKTYDKPGTLRYFDTQSQGWRSFLIENLVSVG